MRWFVYVIRRDDTETVRMAMKINVAKEREEYEERKRDELTE